MFPIAWLKPSSNQITDTCVSGSSFFFFFFFAQVLLENVFSCTRLDLIQSGINTNKAFLFRLKRLYGTDCFYQQRICFLCLKTLKFLEIFFLLFFLLLMLAVTLMYVPVLFSRSIDKLLTSSLILVPLSFTSS
jgi:hypothetical protein